MKTMQDFKVQLTKSTPALYNVDLCIKEFLSEEVIKAIKSHIKENYILSKEEVEAVQNEVLSDIGFEIEVGKLDSLLDNHNLGDCKDYMRARYKWLLKTT